MYPARCKLSFATRGARGDQRISVISSTSSNTTSGIVSDRVHSEDEPDTAPASTECLPRLTEGIRHGSSLQINGITNGSGDGETISRPMSPVSTVDGESTKNIIIQIISQLYFACEKNSPLLPHTIRRAILDRITDCFQKSTVSKRHQQQRSQRDRT